MLGYLAENPPASLILAAVYSTPESRKKKTSRKSEVTEDDYREMMQAFGGNASPIPDAMRKQLEWAAAEAARINASRKG